MLNNNIKIPNDFAHKTQTMMEQFFADASAFYKRSFTLPDLVFFHRGTAAGKANYSAHTLALNYPLLQREGMTALHATVGHEVAHFIVQDLYGRKAQAHGKEWRYVMQEVLGLPAKRTHQFAVTDLKTRTLQTFAYQCECSHHTLTSIRHNRVQSGKQEYRCKKCGEKLVYKP